MDYLKIWDNSIGKHNCNTNNNNSNNNSVIAL